jgi:hypothetical protein
VPVSRVVCAAPGTPTLRTFYACSVVRTKRFVTDPLTGQDSVRQQTQRQKRCPRLCPPFGHKGYQPGIQTERDARSVWFTGRLAARRAVDRRGHPVEAG